MKAPKFELNKIKSQIKRHGFDCTFKRFGKNNFGESDDTQIPIYDDVLDITFGCIFHEASASAKYIKESVTEAAVYRSKKIPMLMCDFTETVHLKPGDIATVNNKEYKVTGIKDIGEWGIIADISLEVI